MTEDYQDLLRNVSIETRAFINGEYVKAIGGKTFKDICPINNEIIAEIESCDDKDIDFAVKSARKSVEEGKWSELAPEKRKEILFRFANCIEDNLNDLAIMECIDIGKPISAAIGEIKRCVAGIKWFAEAIDKVYGDIATTESNRLANIIREPYGVIGAIIPWNYPLMMAVWKFAPALAAGNSIVLKPAEQSPLSLIKIAGLAKEAGIPDGVFNVVPGYGEIAGKALACHMDIDKITFTGSTEVGKLVMQYSGQSNLKNVSLECGGKSANIVFADANDLDYIAKQTVGSMFYNSGQVCDAPTRLLVEEEIYDIFVDKIINESKKYMPINPLERESQMGCMVSAEQMERVLEYIEIGKSEGAKLVLGGNQVLKETNGFYIEPTIFSDVRNNMRIAQEEIFGPVLSIIKFKTSEEVIDIANDSIYGLCSFIWTSNINRALYLSKKIKAGKVLINSMSDSNWSVPHGGFKQSGFGRDKSIESLMQYSNSKLIFIETNKDYI